MKDNLTRKIAFLEIPSLAPKVSSEWIESVAEFGPFEYLQFLPEGSAGRKLAALSNDFKWPGNNDIKTRRGDLTAPDMRAAMSRWFFHTNLVTALNSNANELILSVRHRLEVMKMISQFEDRLSDTNSTLPQTDTVNIGLLSALLVEKHEYIDSNIRELRAFRLGSASISEKFGEGNELLLRDLGDEINELCERTEQSAQQYQQTLEALWSQPIPPDTKWLPDLCDIDFDAIDEDAKTESDAIVSRLIALAYAEMLIAFGQTSEALETLQPYLETTDAKPQEE